MNLEALLDPVVHDVKPCKLYRTVLGLDEPYREALQKLVDTAYQDGGLSDAGLVLRMKRAGLYVSQPVVWRHRTKVCSCYRGE